MLKALRKINRVMRAVIIIAGICSCDLHADRGKKEER